MAADKINIKYLGIDWGKKRIGLAMGDSSAKLAIPLKTVADIKEIISAVREEEITELVIGEPLKMNRSEVLDKNYIKFIDDLSNSTKLPLHFIDERFSSLAADALPGDKRAKAGRDEIAAMIILQSYLDQL